MVQKNWFVKDQSVGSLVKDQQMDSVAYAFSIAELKTISD
jgi:hypothetical protein